MTSVLAEEASEGDRVPERTSRRQLVENELLDRAADLFAERGFEGTTLADIAAAVGITRPSLYNYIKSKDDLLGALVSGLTEAGVSDLKNLRARDLRPADRLAQAVRALTLRICEHPARFRMLDRSEHLLPGPLQQRHRTAKRAILTSMIDIIARGVEEGEFWPEDERAAALSILGSINWVAWWFRPDAPGADPSAVADQFARMAVRSLARGADDGRPGAPGAALAAIRADLDYLERRMNAADLL
jgi:AcrR family transcriptional regulator